LNNGPKGLILVNVLNIEDYLKAVVPSELSPEVFRELEAHKAQAVAARTYAIKNMHSNESLGFDLCDTPRSQFYRGMEAEHPMSNRAVDQTRGEVALFQGSLIDALYTSTCGGMTEDAENIFGGQPLPYLKGTECAYERLKKWTLKTKARKISFDVNGRDIGGEIAFLTSAGVLPFDMDLTFFRTELSSEDLDFWNAQIADIVGSDLSVAELAVNVAGWSPKKTEENGVFKEAVFKQTAPAVELTNAEMAHLFWKAFNKKAGQSNRGTFHSLNGQAVTLNQNGNKIIRNLSPEAYLVKNYGGETILTGKVSLIGDEKIRWIESGGTIQYFEVLYPYHSQILDQKSSHHSWNIRRSRKALERRINRYFPVGSLIDIVVLKRGKSKRVIELLIKGTEGEVAVTGLKIRRVLGLQDTLFVIERERDQEKQISSFHFIGKGWGHGVGLCQVGAFGMARAGNRYKEILKKYYQGITIGKIYGYEGDRIGSGSRGLEEKAHHIDQGEILDYKRNTRFDFGKNE